MMRNRSADINTHTSSEAAWLYISSFSPMGVLLSDSLWVPHTFTDVCLLFDEVSVSSSSVYRSCPMSHGPKGEIVASFD